MDLSLVEKAATLLVQSKYAVALTGAGISTESGIPDFRSPGGIWERYDPTVFYYQRFLAEPAFVWKTIIEMGNDTGFSLFKAEPNKGHKALAALEEMGILKSVITQNIDNLHQKAGSKRVIEFHGNMLYVKCIKCSRKYSYTEVLERIDMDNLPPRCECGGVLKPDAVFFGEAIPQMAMTEAFSEANMCDLMLVVGTSAQVEPAASLPSTAKGQRSMFSGMSDLFFPKEKAHVIEINRESTSLTDTVSDFLIKGAAGEVLSSIVDKVMQIKGI